MLISEIKQSFRQMATKKLTTIVQVVGLGIGLGSVILMMVYILHEYSFDKYHKNSKNIYRVVYDKDCTTPHIMGETFKAKIPEIKNVFSIYFVWNTMIKSKDEFVKEDNFMLADPSIFSILDIPIIEGNPKFILQDNNDVIISNKAAHKYFGEKNPIGKPIEINISGRIVTCNVSGIFKPFPSNSSIQSDFIGNIKLIDEGLSNQVLNFTSGLNTNKVEAPNPWDQGGYQTFLLIPGNHDVSSIENKATAICQKEDKNNKERKIHLQAFTQMYFHSEELWNLSPMLVSNVKTMRIFEGIAILILLIAWFNYILLSTAETKSQLKEVACRKVLGASPGQITRKAYVHSINIVLLSLVLAIIFVQIIIPLFNHLFDKNIDFRLFLTPTYLLAILVIAIGTGLAGGSYISFYTTKLKPVDLFKPLAGNQGSEKVLSSGIMIVFQFFVFILLITSAITIDKQIRFSENTNQGFNTSNVLVFKLNNQELRNKVTVIRSRFEADPHVQSVATSSFIPPSMSVMAMSLGKDKNSERIRGEGIFIGANFIELLQIPVLDGNSYHEGNESNEVIINESAANKYKVKAGDLLGTFRVKGIVNDFHLHSMHEPIIPVFLLRMNDGDCYELAVKTDGNNKEIISTARKIWAELLPTSSLEYEAVNDRILSFYDKEKKQARTITFFSFLAIALAIMGLFGYVSIRLIKRTKEIGVRKVNGARTVEVMIMLNKNIIKWIIIAFIIATPIAYYAMQKWLEDFAYKTELSWWIFASAGLIALGIAILTVSWQSWKAATKNPVEALRYE